jgi:hypothetical protein
MTQRRPPHGHASTSSRKVRFSRDTQLMRATVALVRTTPLPSPVRALPLDAPP